MGITKIPLELLHKEYKEYGKEKFMNSKVNNNHFIKRFKIKQSSADILPGILHYFSTLPVKPAINSEGKIDCNEFIRPHMSDWFKGLLILTVVVNRSSISKGTATSPSMSDYNTLVPLALAGQKKYNDVPYNAWDRGTLAPLVSKSLKEAMLWEPKSTNILLDDAERKYLAEHHGIEDDEANTAAEINVSDFTKAFATKFKKGIGTYGFSDEDLLNIRQQCCTNIKSEWALNPSGDYAFDELPALVKHMALQTWCCTPERRSKYMILNPIDWDDMPTPLIGNVVFKEEVKQQKQSEDSDLPWNT